MFCREEPAGSGVSWSWSRSSAAVTEKTCLLSKNRKGRGQGLFLLCALGQSFGLYFLSGTLYLLLHDTFMFAVPQVLRWVSHRQGKCHTGKVSVIHVRCDREADCLFIGCFYHFLIVFIICLFSLSSACCWTSCVTKTLKCGKVSCLRHCSSCCPVCSHSSIISTCFTASLSEWD